MSLSAKQSTSVITFTCQLTVSVHWSALAEPEWKQGECPCMYVRMMSCILHTESLFLLMKKKHSCSWVWALPPKSPNHPTRGGPFQGSWWCPRLGLETGWAEGSTGDAHVSPWAALVAPRSCADIHCPGMLWIFSVQQSPASGLLNIPDFYFKCRIWCFVSLKITEVGLLISVGTRAYVGVGFFLYKASTLLINQIIFFQNKFCDAFPHTPQIVRHPAYMPSSPNKYTSDLKSFHKCHHFKATYSCFRSGKPETPPVWNMHSSKDFQFLVLFPRGCHMENSHFPNSDSHLNWVQDIPKEQIVRLSRTNNLNYGHLSIDTHTVGESRIKVNFSEYSEPTLKQPNGSV